MDPVESPQTGDIPEGYPSAYVADVVLADGATACVRPIRPDDGDLLTEFHARQSPQSIYYRYFSPRPRLSERDVERLTHVDYVDRFALVAVRADELIGVARYDRWRHRSEAEVAFFVDDANHGRGLATVMLEHLASRARDVGLTGFTASVLPENRKMIGVFTQAGFETATKFADGVVEVRLGLQPTPEAEAAIEARAQAAAAEAVRRLLSPRSVAVIGASREPGSIGYAVLENLQRAHFAGPVWPVNPQADHVASVRAVPSILDIADDVDLAVIAVPAAAVADVVEECGRKQVYGVVVLSAGFAEQGPEGAALEAEVLRVARSWGVRVVGPNCLGVLNTDPSVSLHATFAPMVPRRGSVSLLSESGMVGAAIIGQARDLGIGISSFVALGNRIDVSGNDLLQYWAGDPSTDVVCMYIESLGNPRHFSRLARRLTRLKPVVAVKTGGLPTSASAAGTDDTEAALLRQTGVIRVPTLAAMLDTVRLLTSQPRPRGRRVAVLGNAGGSLAIAADAIRDAGLELAEIVPASRAVLEGLATHAVGALAVIDLGLSASGPDLAQATSALVADPGVDAVLAVYSPSLGATPEEARAALAGRDPAGEVPVVACFYGPAATAPAAHSDRDVTVGQVPVYGGVDAAARALGHVARYAEWLGLPEGEPAPLDDASAAAARELVQAHLAEGPSALLEPDTLGLLDAVGLPTLPTEVVRSVDEALVAATAMGYPVVLKAAGRDRMAKTAAAGFAIDLEGPEALQGAWERMEASLGDALRPVLVQPMVGPGVDVAIAVRDHPAVGPVLSLGPGGAAAALDRAVDVRVLPLSDLEARRLVVDSRLGPVLDEPGQVALEEALLRVAALVEDLPEVTEMELNPVIIRDGTAVVAQATATVAPVERDPLPPVRRV
jgi:acyl-CoA synthetase (NDP forming)/RimJ/RimL family protein N-acetyltransferase